MADVAIELAIPRVARIAPLRAPYLSGRLGVPLKREHPTRTDDRRVGAKHGQRIGELEGMSVNEEIVDPFLDERTIDPRNEAALG